MSASDHEHTPGHCAHCGHPQRVEAIVEINDRMHHLVAMALADRLGLETRRDGPKASTEFVVLAPDDATLDRYEDTLRQLNPLLEAKLLAVTVAFVKKHVGVAIQVVRPAKK